MASDKQQNRMTRRILVTGAASGIGAAICRALAAPDVAILAHTRRNAQGLEQTITAVHAAGGTALAALGDLADPAVPAALVAKAATQFGGLDVLISNAGFADRTPAAVLDDVAFAVSHDAIAGAFLRLARAAIPHLRQSGSGRIIAIGSFVAHAFRTDLTTFPASAAAKAAMEALVRALAVELGPTGITVNAVIPGFIRKQEGAQAALDPAEFARQTGRIPLSRLGTPEDVAAAVAFLASAQAGYITGQAVHVDGGLVIRA